MNRRLWARLFLVALLTTLVPISSAAALTLMTLRGTVRDPLGTPISAARVSDGDRAVFTNSAGEYTLEEEQVSDVPLVVTKAGYQPDQRTIPAIDALDPTKRFDFTLLFTANVDVSPFAFNNDPQKTLAISLTSLAPAGGCATWTDNTSGTTVALVPSGTTGGVTTWTGDFPVPAGTPDGPHYYSAIVETCTDHRALTNRPSNNYVVDSIAPTFSEIAPRDQGNTVFTNQRIIAQSTDAGSGVDPASLAVSIEDLTDPAQPVQHPVVGLLPGGVLKSGPATLVPNHRYQATVSGSDQAGNEAPELVLQFNVLELVIRPAPTTIDETVGTVSGSISRTARFEDVVLELGAHSVSLNLPSGHPGFGYVAQRVDLTRAKIHLYRTLPDGRDEELPAGLSPIDAPASWGQRTIYSQIVTTRVDLSGQEIRILPVVVRLPELETPVSPLADKAVLQLNSESTPAGPGGMCADPTASCPSEAYPTPDPFPFFIGSSDAESLEAAWSLFMDNARAAAVASDQVLCADQVGGTEPCAFQDLDSVSQGLLFALQAGVDVDNPLRTVWETVTLLGPDDDLVRYGVDYLYEYPLIPPFWVPASCGVAVACSSASAEARASGLGSSTLCADKSGDLEDDDDKKCYQYIRIFIHQVRDWAGRGPNIHYVQGYMGASYGMTDGNRDDIAVAIKLDPKDSAQWTPGWAWAEGGSSRDYKRTDWKYNPLEQEYQCMNAYNGGVSLGGTNAERSQGSWGQGQQGLFGIQHSNLRQRRGEYIKCPDYPGDNMLYAVWDRLWYAGVSGIMSWPNGYQNRKGVIGTWYGHTKTKRDWGWSCGIGPSFGSGGMSVGVGCGYGPQGESEERTWARGVTIPFRY